MAVTRETGQRQTDRVEAFGGSVFVIAIRLLVLELKVPPGDQAAAHGAL
jgi:uncharacterized membrane protein